MPGGRPTKYNQAILDKANDYLENYNNDEYKDVIPSIVGLAIALDIHVDTCYDWAKQEDKKAFSDILRSCMAKQQHRLLNGGLSGELNPNITKLVLGKHGYSDKQETTGANGGPIEVDHNIQIEFIEPENEGE